MVGGLPNGDTVEMGDDTVTLLRPTGPEELALVEPAGWSAWPPRLPEQPIFYPVLNEAYATKIARDWNMPRGGTGYVTRFKLEKSYLDRYEVTRSAAASTWSTGDLPRELDDINEHLVGQIEVVGEFS